MQRGVFESTRFKGYGYSRFKTSVTPMSLFKKLLVILAALIAAGCESGAITQGKQATARCDIYKTGPQ